MRRNRDEDYYSTRVKNDELHLRRCRNEELRRNRDEDYRSHRERDDELHLRRSRNDELRRNRDDDYHSRRGRDEDVHSYRDRDSRYSHVDDGRRKIASDRMELAGGIRTESSSPRRYRESQRFEPPPVGESPGSYDRRYHQHDKNRYS